MGTTNMTKEQILTAARQRGAGQPYAGAVTPQEAYDLLQSGPDVKLVDVRTNAERDWVGRVAIGDAQHLAVQWATYPGGAPNPDFVAQLEQAAGKDDVLLFLPLGRALAPQCARGDRAGLCKRLRHPRRVRRRSRWRRPPQDHWRLVHGGLAVDRRLI